MNNCPSIRKRMLVSTLVTLLLILMIVTIATRYVADHESEEVFSAQLASRARLIDALITQIHPSPFDQSTLVIDVPASLKNDSKGESNHLGHPYEQKIAFQVWSSNGELVAKSANAPSTPFGSPSHQDKSTSINFKPGFSKTTGSSSWYVFTLQRAKPERGWVMVGEQSAIRREVVRELGLGVLMPLLMGTFALLLIMNAILVFNLRPLHYLAQEILSRDPESLKPIATHRLPQELALVANALNELMERVSQAFIREQNLIDACAHEIRTPLAALQLHVQNTLKASNEDQKMQSLNLVYSSAKRTTRLAEQLLIFSRLSGKVDPETEVNIDLVSFIQEILANYAPLVFAKGQNIELIAPDPCTILGQPYKIERLLINLLDNASQYGKTDGNITVSILQQDQKVMLSVSNEGQAIPIEKRASIFDPYVRLSPNQGSGSGLGLAIVKTLVQMHRATIHVKTLPDGSGTVITVTFPLLVQPPITTSSMD